MAFIYTSLASPRITVKASNLDFTPSEVDLQQVHRSVCKIWGDVLNFEQVTNISSNSKCNKYLSRRNFFDFFPWMKSREESGARAVTRWGGILKVSFRNLSRKLISGFVWVFDEHFFVSWSILLIPGKLGLHLLSLSARSCRKCEKQKRLCWRFQTSPYFSFWVELRACFPSVWKCHLQDLLNPPSFTIWFAFDWKFVSRLSRVGWEHQLPLQLFQSK